MCVYIIHLPSQAKGSSDHFRSAWKLGELCGCHWILDELRLHSTVCSVVGKLYAIVHTEIVQVSSN